MFDPGPCVYMEKIAGGPSVADCLSLDRPARRGDPAGSPSARAVEVGDVTVIMLDRPRHEDAVEADPRGGRADPLHHATATSRRPCSRSPRAPGSTCSGASAGTPEGVLSAAAIKCLGGQILGRLWPRDDDERQAAIDAGYDLDEVLDVDRLVAGNDVFFAATGVTDGDLLQGVRYLDDGHATTESLVMRSRSGTVRKVQARHDRLKLREVTGGRYG